MDISEAMIAVALDITLEYAKQARDRQIDVTLIPPEFAAGMVLKSISLEENLRLLQDYLIFGELSPLGKVIIQRAVSETLDRYPIGANVKGN